MRWGSSFQSTARVRVTAPYGEARPDQPRLHCQLGGARPDQSQQRREVRVIRSIITTLATLVIASVAVSANTRNHDHHHHRDRSVPAQFQRPHPCSSTGQTTPLQPISPRSRCQPRLAWRRATTYVARTYFLASHSVGSRSAFDEAPTGRPALPNGLHRHTPTCNWARAHTRRRPRAP
jgi:hypothetical protein